MYFPKLIYAFLKSITFSGYEEEKKKFHFMNGARHQWLYKWLLPFKVSYFLYNMQHEYSEGLSLQHRRFLYNIM